MASKLGMCQLPAHPLFLWEETGYMGMRIKTKATGPYNVDIVKVILTPNSLDGSGY